MASDRPRKPSGTFTPAATIGRVLSQAGYGAFRIRKYVGFGGHRCTWDVYQHAVHVRYSCGDGTPDDRCEGERQEMFALYESLLTAKGYRVERMSHALRVHPKEVLSATKGTP